MRADDRHPLDRPGNPAHLGSITFLLLLGFRRLGKLRGQCWSALIELVYVAFYLFSRIVNVLSNILQFFQDRCDFFQLRAIGRQGLGVKGIPLAIFLRRQNGNRSATFTERPVSAMGDRLFVSSVGNIPTAAASGNMTLPVKIKRR